MYKLHTPEGANPLVFYLQDENGIDWYEKIQTFNPETIKIVVNDKDEVVAYSKDASTLFPYNARVFEVKSLPTNSPSNRWYFRKGKFIPFHKGDEHKAYVARQAIKTSMDEAKGIIDTLRIEREYSDLTPDKEAELKSAAQVYITSKNKLDELDALTKGD